MMQFRLRTRRILGLGSYAVPLPYTKYSTTWIFPVPLPYKSFDFKSRSSASAQIIFSVTWSSAVSLPHKEYTMSRSSAVLLSHTEQSMTWSSAVSHNILWLEFRSSASAFEIPHFCFCTGTLLFFGKSTLVQSPTHSLIFVLSYMNNRSSERQRNKGIGMLLAKVVVNVWQREA